MASTVLRNPGESLWRREVIQLGRQYLKSLMNRQVLMFDIIIPILKKELCEKWVHFKLKIGY